jgi:hypothetical protein
MDQREHLARAQPAGFRDSRPWRVADIQAIDIERDVSGLAVTADHGQIATCGMPVLAMSAAVKTFS